MKRFLAILLLVIVPFQFSWAIAGTYCVHEEGKAAQHFGHHNHQHHASADDSVKDTKESSSKKSHKDCDYCQHSSQPPLLTMVAKLTEPSASLHVTDVPISFSSHIPEGPTKPDRLPVA